MSSIEEPSAFGATELSTLNPGTLFHGRYRVRCCLGSGGMGALYEVVHHETERRCVLKTMLGSLLTDPDMRARFRLEATVTANVESDHIVDVYDAGIDEGTGLPFLVMEYLRGDTLASRLRKAGALAPREAIQLLQQASLALERTHAAGIVHRDLKPENLFITQRDDGTPHLKLLDFGIAKIVAQSTNVNTTRSFGTPLYMSPEQIRGDGDIDGRADLYALAQIAYTVLVGHAYFEPEVIDHTSVYPLLLKVMQGTAVPASERARVHGVALPAAFDSWFATATHADASQRFDTAAEQLTALCAALFSASTVEPGGASDSPAVEARLIASSLAPASEPAGSSQGTTGANAELTPAPNRDLVTLAGVSKSGSHALRQPRRIAARRNVWLVGSLGLAIVASLGLSLQWIRVKPSQTPSADTAANQPAAPRATHAASSVEVVSALPTSAASREPTIESDQGSAGSPHVAANVTGVATIARLAAARPPIASASATGSANSARLRFPISTPRKPASSASQRDAAAAPLRDTTRSRATVTPNTAAYDPSDIR